MTKLEWIVNISFIALCLFAVAWSVLSIRKLNKLKERFHAAIVLIPLYKKTNWTMTAIVLVFLIMAGDIAFGVFVPEYAIASVCIFVICIAMQVLLGTMLRTRCAVLDGGIVVPFRFIDWTHFYDYSVEGNTIFFIGDDKGFDTLSAATTKLKFDEGNLEKLEYILSKHKSAK